MAVFQTLWIRDVIDTGTILVLVLTGIMIVFVIILRSGVVGDTFRMILRKKLNLPLTER